MSPSSLVGRDSEVALLQAQVRGIEQRGAALVLRGGPGAGKSSLLAEAARQATAEGRRLLVVTGVESEARVPFSALHRLLGPVLAGVESLPRRQREALLSAFGEADAAAEPYLASYAALELLADHAPIVLLVDDVQWVDPVSASALAFIARRLEHEPVVAVFTLRDGHDSPFLAGGIPELAVPPLDEQHAAELLDRHASGLSPAVRRQLLDLAAGNPLALLELPKAWRSHDDVVPLHGALTARLERSFAREVEALPGGARTAAVVAAANDGDDLFELVRALGVLVGVQRAEDHVAAAVDGGVLVVDEPRVRFRHPLVRSACYQVASPSERRAAHAALVDVVAGSWERGLWHRAASTLGPDDDVAADLDRAAESAAHHGSTALAAAVLTRAAELSGTETERGHRFTVAAEFAFESGQHAQGLQLLHQADACELSVDDRLRLSWLKEAFEDRSWSGVAKVRAVCELASRLAARGQLSQALQMMMSAALRCWWSNPDEEMTQAVVETAEGLGADPDDPTLVTVLAYGGPLQRGRLVAERVAAIVPSALEQPAWALELGTAATAVGAFPAAAPLLDDAVARFRARGEMNPLVQALVSRLLTDYQLGRWDAARTAGEEVRRLAVDTALPIWGMAAAATECMVAAAQGDRDGVDRLGRMAEGYFVPLGARTFLAPVEIARGHVALSRGRHEQALDHLRGVFDPGGRAHHRYARHWAVLDHVTAALALNRVDEAREVAAAAEADRERSRSPLLDAALVAVRPVIAAAEGADESDVEWLFQVGVGERLLAWPFLHARHLLAFGSWLRRQRRERESRSSLRASRYVFDALGAVPWYEQAVRELRASGEAGGEREPSALDQLSPQERHIAQLAAAGMTNREIGQHLYLSHRTVGSHLYRIFPKLGITSRRQLGEVLPVTATPRGGDGGLPAGGREA